MNEKNLRIIRYLTGAMITVQLITAIIYFIDGKRYFGWIQRLSNEVELLGILLMAVSIFIGIDSLLTVGAGMRSLGILVGIFTERYYLTDDRYVAFILFISYALIALSAQQKKNAIAIGIVSAVLIMIGSVLSIMFVREESFWLALYITVNYGQAYGQAVLLATTAVLTCFTVQNTPQSQTIKVKRQTAVSKTDDRVEKLTKLKQLLDSGVITQEEFEAKKKQILGI